MRLLETGNDKVKKICEVLKRETIDPARQQAESIIEEAKAEAEKIIASAEQKSTKMLKETEDKIASQQEVFKASIQVAFKQSIGKLKSEIFTKVFQQGLLQKIRDGFQDPNILGECLKVICQSLNSMGSNVDPLIIVSKKFDKNQLSQMIVKLGLEHLQNKIIPKGDFSSGIQIRIENENLTIDITDQAVEQLILKFSSDTLKKLIFNS